MRQGAWLGTAAALASALIGGGWQVATRHSTTGGGLGPLDLAVLRYCIPAAVLLPCWWGLLRTVDLRGQGMRLLWIAVGGGLPFGLLAMTGTRFAPAAHMGVLMPGISPLLVAALAWLLWRERPRRAQLAGLACIALGVAGLGAGSFAQADARVLLGDLLYLSAALLWTAFMLAFRGSGLSPWQGAAWINATSTLLLLPWLLWQGAPVLAAAPLSQWLPQALWQGVLAGLVALGCVAIALHRLGPAKAAAFSALAPAVSALGGWWWLGERLALHEWAAVACATVGVALASGVVRYGAAPR
ncbi:MAG: DMT family transporter [Pseudomonadota bacterium]